MAGQSTIDFLPQRSLTGRYAKGQSLAKMTYDFLEDIDAQCQGIFEQQREEREGEISRWQESFDQTAKDAAEYKAALRGSGRQAPVFADPASLIPREQRKAPSFAKTRAALKVKATTAEPSAGASQSNSADFAAAAVAAGKRAAAEIRANEVASLASLRWKDPAKESRAKGLQFAPAGRASSSSRAAATMQAGRESATARANAGGEALLAEGAAMPSLARMVMVKPFQSNTGPVMDPALLQHTGSRQPTSYASAPLDGENIASYRARTQQHREDEQAERADDMRERRHDDERRARSRSLDSHHGRGDGDYDNRDRRRSYDYEHGNATHSGGHGRSGHRGSDASREQLHNEYDDRGHEDASGPVRRHGTNDDAVRSLGWGKIADMAKAQAGDGISGGMLGKPLKIKLKKKGSAKAKMRKKALKKKKEKESASSSSESSSDSSSSSSSKSAKEKKKKAKKDKKAKICTNELDQHRVFSEVVIDQDSDLEVMSGSDLEVVSCAVTQPAQEKVEKAKKVKKKDKSKGQKHKLAQAVESTAARPAGIAVAPPARTVVTPPKPARAMAAQVAPASSNGTSPKTALPGSFKPVEERPDI